MVRASKLVMVVGVIASGLSLTAQAERADVLERIRPIGEVSVAQPAAPVAPAPVESAPAPSVVESATSAVQEAAGTVSDRVQNVAESAMGAASDAMSAMTGALQGMTGGTSADGEKVYQATCFVCHGTGAAGAPKLGDAAAWAPRVAQGRQTLVQHALNGKGAMPARGGNPNLTDEEIVAAIDYMVSRAE